MLAHLAFRPLHLGRLPVKGGNSEKKASAHNPDYQLFLFHQEKGKMKKRIAITLALISIVVLSLAGCGGSKLGCITSPLNHFMPACGNP